MLVKGSKDAALMVSACLHIPSVRNRPQHSHCTELVGAQCKTYKVIVTSENIHAEVCHRVRDPAEITQSDNAQWHHGSGAEQRPAEGRPKRVKLPKALGIQSLPQCVQDARCGWETLQRQHDGFGKIDERHPL